MAKFSVFKWDHPWLKGRMTDHERVLALVVAWRLSGDANLLELAEELRKGMINDRQGQDAGALVAERLRGI